MISALIFLLGFHAYASTTVKVGSSPVMSSAGIYLAQEMGFFAKEGLNVEVSDFANSGAPMTALLAKGELDVGAGNLTSGLFSAMAQGYGFKIVADKGHIEKNRDYLGLLVRADHIQSGRYKQLSDLKGFKMALTALDGVSQQILVEKFLSKAGLKAADVQFVKLSYAEMNVALKTKQIDASIQLEPFLSKAHEEGFAKVVAGGSEAYPEQQSAALIFSPQFMKNRRPDAVKFMKAYIKGVRQYNRAFLQNQGRAEVVAALKKHVALDDAKLWDKMQPVGLNDDAVLKVDALMADVNWYFDKKYLSKKLTAQDVVDLSFAKEAAKLISDGVKR